MERQRRLVRSSDLCVCCGEEVPEGTMVCRACLAQAERGATAAVAPDERPDEVSFERTVSSP